MSLIINPHQINVGLVLSFFYSNDDGGYGLNTFISNHFNSIVQYTIWAKSYSSTQFGAIKGIITPSTEAVKDG